MIVRYAAALVACAASTSAFAGPPAAPARRALAASTADAATGLADTQLVLKFACFGFKDRDCLLTLGSGGTATFSAGMVSDGPGEWRVAAGVERNRFFSTNLRENFEKMFNKIFKKFRDRLSKHLQRRRVLG